MAASSSATKICPDGIYMLHQPDPDGNAEPRLPF
jgi:hypothetical protein